MSIYAWENIPEEVLKEEYDLYLRPDSPKASPYYNQELVVNMKYNGVESFLQDGKKTNKQGWSRDSQDYWKTMLERHPKAFDTKNTDKILSGKSPKVNQQLNWNIDIIDKSLSK